MPQVVHCHKGVLYEEPLIACLAVTLESVQGQLAVAGASAGASGARSGSSFDGSPTPRSSLQLAPASPSAALLADSKQHGKPKLLGRLFHRRCHSSNNSNGGNSSTLTPVSSNIDDKMVAGEDWGDECELKMPSLLLKPFSCTQLCANLLAGDPWVSSCAALLPALSTPPHFAAACAPLAPCRRRPLIL